MELLCRNEVNDNAEEDNANNYRINISKTIASKYFEYKTKLIGSAKNDHITLNKEIVDPLKYFINFGKFDDWSLSIVK